MARIPLQSLLTVLALLVAFGLVGAGPASALQAGPASSVETLTRVAVAEDGTAAVTVEVRTPLTDDASREAFARYQRDVEANRSAELAPFVRSVDGLVGRAAETTGREMTAGEYAVDTEVVTLPRAWGVVRYTFTWSNFAAVDGDALRVEGVLSGYLLSAGDTLVVSVPEGYAFDAVRPAPDESTATSAVWRGPTEFAPDEPRLAAVPSGAAGGPSGEGAGGPAPRLGGDALPVVLALAVLGALGGGFYLTRRDDGFADGEGSDPGPAEAAGTEEHVRTDREVFLDVLREGGGRLRQQELVSRTGWSETKVSKVSSALVEAGAVHKLRLGRENLVGLAGEFPLGGETPEGERAAGGDPGVSGHDADDRRSSGRSG